MTSFVVIWSNQAKKDLSQLDRCIAKRILEKVEEACKIPFHYFKYNKNYSLFKLRVGDYRVYVDFNLKDKKIEIITVGHRKEFYKGIR